jgi:hypothetical protein
MIGSLRAWLKVMSFDFEDTFPERISSRSIRVRYIWKSSRQLEKTRKPRYSHLLGVNFQIQVFGSDDIAYQGLQSLANMGGLLGPNIVKGNVDIHRMSMDHIGECFCTFYLF